MDDSRIALGEGEVMLQFETKAGNTSLLEQYLLVSIIKKHGCTTFFEIGTFDGQTTETLAKNIPTLSLLTLDLPAERSKETAIPISQNERRYIEKPIIGKRFRGTPEAARITQLLGDSATFDYTPYLGRMDAVFIDGCHDEAYVANDTQKALTLLTKRGGVVIWHDYLTYDSVTRYLEKLSETLPLLSVQGTSLVLHLRSEPGGDI
jgi:hypothetical protein